MLGSPTTTPPTYPSTSRLFQERRLGIDSFPGRDEQRSSRAITPSSDPARVNAACAFLACTPVRIQLKSLRGKIHDKEICRRIREIGIAHRITMGRWTGIPHVETITPGEDSSMSGDRGLGIQTWSGLNQMG
ncbi:hypothetical protein EVAR_77518_1 [Eumeta japonica]|uniref:Uncharacterized protein n=1 Tax=Eumeta variegata TaxID=151549 RepID=A0A4C1T6E9_EUMVA|nr:hypothetical protein EVAR_77518_1 [Eumeta japonica]